MNARSSGKIDGQLAPSVQDQLLDDVILPAFPGQVSLVAKYTNPLLGFDSDGPVRVFLPDFHWMSTVCLKRYSGGYQFNGARALSGRAPLFATLLTVLEELDRRARPPLEIYQLGDRFDLWRELTPEDQADILAAYQRVRRDPNVSGLADRLDALRTKYVRGNHDTWLARLGSEISDSATLAELESPDGRIYLTHGHRYDSVERLLPDDVKVGGVWLCPKIKPGKHDIGPFSNSNTSRITSFLKIRNKVGPHNGLYPTVRPDGAISIKSSSDIAVIEKSNTTYLDLTQFWHGSDDRNDFEHVSYLEFGDQILSFEQTMKNDHCLHVIGHTHHARLLVDQLPDKRPFVILDAGGWIEDCTIKLAGGQAYRAPSAQIGVQAGNDVRIYQFGGTAG